MVVKVYNCTNAKWRSADTKRSSNDTLRIPVNATLKKEDYWVEVFLNCLNSTCSKIKLITINILFHEDKTIGRTSYMYSVAGYMWLSLYISCCFSCTANVCRLLFSQGNVTWFIMGCQHSELEPVKGCGLFFRHQWTEYKIMLMMHKKSQFSILIQDLDTTLSRNLESCGKTLL